VTTQAQILDLMLELQSDYGMALLFITHDLGVVAEIADNVAVMYLGQIVERSDADTVFNAAKHPYTQALLRSIPKIAMRREELEPIKGMVPSPFRRPPAATSIHAASTRGIAVHRNHLNSKPSVMGIGPPAISLRNWSCAAQSWTSHESGGNNRNILQKIRSSIRSCQIVPGRAERSANRA